MKAYKQIGEQLLAEGELRPNRTSESVIGLWDLNFRHDLRDGFPLVTTKNVPYRSVFAELEGFIRGVTSAADFRQFGTKIWDKNANEDTGWIRNPFRAGEDDLGPIYGAQWREFRDVKMLQNKEVADGFRIKNYLHAGYKPMVVPNDDTVWVLERKTDQLANLIHGLIHDPFGRRHIVTAWHPGLLDQVALPACHAFFQCYVGNGGFLDLKMYQRSADFFLGVPFNIASYAALTHVIAQLTNLTPRRLTLTFGDIHVYESHIPLLREQLSREERELPELSVRPGLTNIDDFCASDLQVHGYEPHPSLGGSMAIAK